MRVSGWIEAPSQGVTQASDQIRLKNQAADLQQCLVDIPDGHRKRPPLDFVGNAQPAIGVQDPYCEMRIITDPDTGALLYFVLNNEESGSNWNVKPYLFEYPSLTPVTCNITTPARTYLNTNNNPGDSLNVHQDIGITQAVDYTILCNRTVVAANQSGANPTRNPEGLVFIKTGGYAKTYTLTITIPSTSTTLVCSVTTPDGNVAADATWVGTDTILSGLMGPPTPVGGYTVTGDGALVTFNGTNGLNMYSALLSNGFTVEIAGAVGYLKNTVDFTMAIFDDQGGTAADVIKDSVTAFSDLPNSGPPNGFTIKIDPQAAEGSLASGAYYLQYNTSSSWSSNSTGGTWKECVGPGSALGIDPTTMPVALTKTSGTWGIDVLPWTARTVGDATLSPDPEFVGSVIEDVGYCFERLALISSEEVFLCAVDNPFRIYPSTMTTQVDSDPFSMITPGASRAYFYSIIPFNRTFIVFGRRKQAVISPPAQGPVTPSSTRLEELTSYETEDINFDRQLTLRPTFSDRYAYYPQLRSENWFAIYEIALDRLSNQPLSEDLTPHLPRYLPSTIDRAVTVQSAYLILYAESGGNDIWAHMFRYGGSGYNYQRLQNAWQHWNLPANWSVAAFQQRGTLIHFLLKDPSGFGRFCSMDTAPQALDPDISSTIQTMLDIRVIESQCPIAPVYTASTNTTLIQIPIILTANHRIAVRAPVTKLPEGYLGNIENFGSPANTYLTVQGDWTGVNFFVGVKYTSTWELNTIYYVDQAGHVYYEAPLTLQRLKAALYRTSFMGCLTQVGNRAGRSYSLKNNILGSPMLYTGQWEVPVAGDNAQLGITFINDSHLPHRISGFNWWGEFDAKAQRVN